MSAYTFPVHCPVDGADVHHETSSKGTLGEQAVVVKCPDCRRRYVIRVRLVPT